MMAFLRRLFLLCRNWFANRSQAVSLPVDVTPPASPELDAAQGVSRYLYTKSHFAKGRPKPSSFDPGRYDELSTVHATGLSDADIWEIGRSTIGTEPGRRRIYARADVPVAQLHPRRLRALRDNNPFPRHTSIVGWPNPGDANERKARILEICLALSQCEDVNLVVPKTPVEAQG